WENTYFEWMRNIQPWCISRQLWWGHQIPAWYGPDGRIFVAMTEGEAVAAAREHYGEAVTLERDPDVLDTWFSSALWPFSTLDWPRGSPELERFYPTDVLVTAYDIIFFWVARMMMMGLRFMGEVPFRDVCIHGLVRDEAGQKMSKTRGNVIDPLGLIDAYGADALRFAILASTAQGRDVKFGEGRVQGYRNFITKLWNAARFCELNGCRLAEGFDPAACRRTLNRWIVGETARVAAEVGEALRSYRFNDAALALYRFTWDLFCDWYVELAKPLLTGDDEEAKAETRAAAGWTLAQVLHLLHPMTPFVTEELWDRLFGAPGGMLIAARWPEPPEGLIDAEAAAELDWLIRGITAIRAARTELNVPASARLELRVRDASPLTRGRLARHGEAFRRLARLDGIDPGAATLPAESLQVVVDEATFALPVSGIVDLEAERRRLAREIERAAQEIERYDRKLADARFVDRAPAEVVEEQRARRAQAEQGREKLRAALARIA
ncbi:MAG TPA: class I tRNA ligase family protein, partial [Geminicoccaceae bacterium]|nr:class I tRNA ligase family protein [Geminicoccaceae bacterium]